MEESYFSAASEEEITRERRKAKELRRTQWWKNRLAFGKCHYCEQSFPPKELTMDHVVPIARGGKSSKSNVVPCCKECNNQKQHFLPVEWKAYLEYLARPD
jgi:5-methylcytosine-specific restriction protein A